MRLPRLTSGLTLCVACSNPQKQPPSPETMASPVLSSVVEADSRTLHSPDAGATTGDAADAGEQQQCLPATWAPSLRTLTCFDERFFNRPAGFSRDGKTLAMCTSPWDGSPLSCSFDEGANHTTMTYFSIHTLANAASLSEAQIEKIQVAHDKNIDDYVTAKGFARTGNQRTLSGPFAYPDIRFAFKTSGDDKTGIQTLHVGAQVADEEAVFSYALAVGPHSMRHVAPPKTVRTPAQLIEWNSQWGMSEPACWLDISPDGKELAVIALSSGAMWFESSKMFRVPVTQFVAAAYNDTGLAFHKKGAYVRAAELFGKAADVRPGESLFLYNQASAYARLNHPGTEVTLAKAIKIGGSSVLKRAKLDNDFGEVRKEPWFKKLVP